MSDLPFELVDYIMKFSGAYYHNINERPYIKSINYLNVIIPCHGVARALIHLKELEALEKAYENYLEGWPIPNFTIK